MSHDPRQPGDRRDPFAPEERALADRLARLGPQGEPSPSLDARILDAARAAAGAPASAASTSTHRAPPVRRHRRRRWPVAFGAAATLVIVGGLAWQLRPVDDMQVTYSEAPRVASGPSADAVPPHARTQEAAPAPAEAATPAVAETVRHPTAGDEASATPRPPQASADATPAHEEQRAPAAFRQVPPPPAEPPVVFDEASPMDTPAPPPAPPAPPAPAPVAPAPSQPTPMPAPPATPRVAADRAAAIDEAGTGMQRAEEEAIQARRAPVPQVATGTATHSAEPAAASAAAESGSLDSVVVTGTRVDEFGDQPIDDQPPASADSPQVQEAWLRRVRQLMSEGRLDEARESLREYQHRYPKATLPEDLRALLAG